MASPKFVNARTDTEAYTRHYRKSYLAIKAVNRNRSSPFKPVQKALRTTAAANTTQRPQIKANNSYPSACPGPLPQALAKFIGCKFKAQFCAGLLNSYRLNKV